MSHRPVLTASSLLLAALLASACGSTVQERGSATVAGGLAPVEQGGGPAGAGPATDADAVVAGSATAAPGVARGTTTGTDGPLGTAPGPAPAGGAVPAPGQGVPGPSASRAPAGGTGTRPAGGSDAASPGVTDKEVYVGLVYDKNAGALNKAAGAGGITSGDSKQDQLAVIDDINKHGGVGGRTLKPVFADIDSTSSQTVDQQYAAVCQRFTRDRPRVFAVEGPVTASYLECVSRAGLPVLDDDLPRLGADAFATHPNLVTQGYADVDRLAAHHVAPLVAQRYFSPWNTTTGAPAATGAAKVGVLTYDDRVFSRATEEHLLPALRKQGYDPVVVQVAQAQSASDLGALSAAVQSAELTFASRGVTHVIIFEANGTLTQLFLPNAQSQRYFPRYAFNSANAPQALLTAGVMDKKQAEGALGYGWLPNLDLPPELNEDDGPYANAARRRCAAVMKSHGISFTSSNAQGIGYVECTNLYLLKAALDRVQGTVTLRSFLSAIDGLGASYQPAGGLGPRSQAFAAGRHDPQDREYAMGYFPDCGCFHYSGGAKTIA